MTENIVRSDPDRDVFHAAQIRQLEADTQVAVARAHEAEARAEAQKAQAKLDTARTVVELTRGDWDKTQVVLTQAQSIRILMREFGKYSLAPKQYEIIRAVVAGDLSLLYSGAEPGPGSIPSDVND